MQRASIWAVGLALAALTIWGGFGLTRHAIELMDAYKEDALALKPSLDNGAGIIQKVNASSDAQARSALAIERDIRVEMWHLDRTLTAIDSTLNSIPPVTEHLSKTADALTETAHSASGAIQTANQTIAAGQPLLESLTHTADASTLAVQHFDALVQSKDISEAMHHVNGMTASGDAILSDGRRVSDKLTNDYLSPKPWYRKVTRISGDLFDYGALAARHIP